MNDGRGMAWHVQRGLTALLAIADHATHVILAVMAVVVAVDVGCRSFLGFSTQIAEEVASLGLVALIFLSLPGAFRDNALLRVDALYSLVPKRARRVADALFHLLALGVTGIYCVYTLRLALDSFRSGVHSATHLGTPNHIPQFLMTWGFLLLGMVILAGLAALLSDRQTERGEGGDA